MFAEFEGDEAAAKRFVRSQNFFRRHLTREFIENEIREMRAEGASYREIVETLKVSHRDVAKVVKAPATNGSTSEPAPPLPPKITGRDGKQYAATRPQKPLAPTELVRHAERLAKLERPQARAR